jgi:hypothetical protein
VRGAFGEFLVVLMRRQCPTRLAHPLYFGSCRVGSFLTLLVCNPIANVLIRNGLLEGWFAEKPNRINARLQTTNLGVRSSNLFGRASNSLFLIQNFLLDSLTFDIQRTRGSTGVTPGRALINWQPKRLTSMLQLRCAIQRP